MMKGKLFFPWLLLISLSCTKDKDSFIPVNSVPVNPVSPGYPVESHFQTGSGNQPFQDEPVDPDPTKSETYRLKTIYYYHNPSSESPSMYITYDYDSQGNIIKELSIDAPAWILYQNIYEYQNGRLSKMSEFGSKDRKLTILRYVLYSYEHDKLIKEETYDPKGLKLFSWHYLYARNRIVFKYKEGSEGDPDQYKYYYDEKGRLINKESYSRPTSLSYIRTQTYDNQDRIVTQQGFLNGKILDYSVKFKYEMTNKKPLEEVYYNLDNALVNKIHWTYQEQGFPLTKMHEDAAGLNPLELNTYEDGVIIEKRTFHKHFGFSESVRTRYVYERI